MPKKTRALTEWTKPVEYRQVQIIPELDDDSHSLIEKIEENIASVPTSTLVMFYVQGDRIVKRIRELNALVKEAMVLRRDEGKKSGDDAQHRKFAQNEFELTIQERQPSLKIDEDKAFKILTRKGLWEQCVDLEITGDNEKFQEFLKSHRKELKGLNIEVREKFNQDKLSALVTLKKVSVDEIGEMTEESGAPTYALTPKYSAKKLRSGN